MEFNNSYNTTSCVTETEEINELMDDVNQYLLITQGIIVSVIGVVGMVINIFVMTVILANKQLHTRPFILCLQVIVINLIIITTVCTPKVLTSFAQTWLFGSQFCKILASSTVLVLVWRWPVMFLMILDRLLTVNFPFCYKKHANKIMMVSSILIPFYSLLVTLAPLVGIGCYSFRNYKLTCTISWQCHSIICYLHYVFTVVALFVIGAIVPIIMYVVMYIKAWKFRKDLMNQSAGASDNSQHRKSERRAQKTILLLFSCLFCLTLPGLLMYAVIEAFEISPSTTLLIVYQISSDMYYCVPIADAVVILRNRDIKSAIKKNMKDRGFNCCSSRVTQASQKVSDAGCTEVQSTTDTFTSFSSMRRSM